MSRLREKSNINYESAQLLIDKSYYAPSVHCAYYSVFQLLKYTLSFFSGDSYDEISQKISLARYQGSHKYIITEILKYVKNDNREDYRKIKRKLTDLKHFREQSDYDDVEVTFDNSRKSYLFATEIREYINSKF